MIASLPMYDWPELTSATDAFWQIIGKKMRATGIDAPEFLSRSDDDERYWLEPELLLGQTCGYPFSTILRDKVQYVATPVYGVEGCNGPYYSSAIVVKKGGSFSMENIATGCFAYNATMSQSGYRTVKALLGDPLTYFASTKKSSGHRVSARMVANDDADVAALDAVCWHLLQAHEPETAEMLKVIAWTQKRPALPLITSLATTAATIKSMRKILSMVSAPGELAISGFEQVDITEYNALATF